MRISGVVSELPDRKYRASKTVKHRKYDRIYNRALQVWESAEPYVKITCDNLKEKVTIGTSLYTLYRDDLNAANLRIRTRTDLINPRVLYVWLEARNSIGGNNAHNDGTEVQI